MRLLTQFVVTVMFIVFSIASPLYAQDYRGWVDVNFIGASSAQEEQLFTRSFVFRGTAFEAATAYPELPNAKSMDVGGGVQFHNLVGIGIQWDRAKYEYIAGIGLSGSSLLSSVDSDSTGTLERVQNAVNINGVLIVPTPDAWRIRVFGGPTYSESNKKWSQISSSPVLLGSWQLETIPSTRSRNLAGALTSG